MTANRFEQIKRFFHINDRQTQPEKGHRNYDKVIDSVLEKSRKVTQEEKQSIDEQMIPTKSRSHIRQYMPNKPHKWRFKAFARCGVSGILYDFDVYLGKQNKYEKEDEFGKIEAQVIKLCENLPKQKNHKL